jgi:hypothetical protein
MHFKAMGGTMETRLTLTLSALLIAASIVRPAIADDALWAEAKKCSDDALRRYALSNAEPAEKVTAIAFEKCSDQWERAALANAKIMDTSPVLKEAQENCVKKLGSSCPPARPSIVYLMDALRRTFQHDAIIQVFDIRAEASRK